MFRVRQKVTRPGARSTWNAAPIILEESTPGARGSSSCCEARPGGIFRTAGTSARLSQLRCVDLDANVVEESVFDSAPYRWVSQSPEPRDETSAGYRADLIRHDDAAFGVAGETGLDNDLEGIDIPRFAREFREGNDTHDRESAIESVIRDYEHWARAALLAADWEV